MKMIGNYRAFSVAMTDEELIKEIPIAAEELLVELFDACGKSALKPKIETLEIFYKHAGKYDGPFGMVDPSNDSEKPIRATLAVKIGAEESGN